MVFPEEKDHRGHYDSISNVYDGATPSLVGGGGISREFIYKSGCKRVQWSELPEEWQRAFLNYMEPVFDDEEWWRPEEQRGLWLVGNQPGATK